MRLVQLEDIGVFFPGRTLFEHVNWAIFRGQRIGLVGVNGAGKSTILKIIADEAQASVGKLVLTRETTVGYLPQSGISFRGRELFAEAWSGLPDIPHLQEQLDHSRDELARNPDDRDLLEHVGVLEHRFHMLEGYRAEAKVAAILGGLGFREQDFKRTTDEFSGGWQMRIAISKLLLRDPDILLLDEPTNHLDLQTVVWLEGFLRAYEGAVVLVSHDRQFLDGMVTEIAELQNGELSIYLGNYSNYEAGRGDRIDQIAREQEKIDVERKHLEKFVERFRAKASKATQAQSRMKRLEKLEDVQQLTNTKRIHFRFPPAAASGKWVLELAGVGKHYGANHVFDGVDLLVQRGERIALVGSNGAGKSTLCRLISQQEQATAGKVIPGHNVKVEFFAQEAESKLNLNATVIEEVEFDNRTLSYGELRGLLGAFLFQGDDVNKKVQVLSGGEKSRLALAKLMLRPANFLILDEPTNHLDMASQDVLLDALKHYGGTLLVVSHDRHFLDRLVNRVLEMDGGTLRDWPGTLSEFLSKKGLSEAASQSEKRGNSKLVTGKSDSESRPKQKDQKRFEAEIRNRFSAQTKVLKETCTKSSARIELLEQRQKQIETQLANDNSFQGQQKTSTVLKEFKALREELPKLYARWQEAEQELEKIEGLKNKELENVRSGGNA